MAKTTGRTAILVRCSEEEAAAIHEAAKNERRTISGFILKATADLVRESRERLRGTRLPGSRDKDERP